MLYFTNSTHPLLLRMLIFSWPDPHIHYSARRYNYNPKITRADHETVLFFQ